MRARVMKMFAAGVVLSAAVAVSSPAQAAEMPAGALEKLVGLYVPMQEALAVVV